MKAIVLLILSAISLCAEVREFTDVKGRKVKAILVGVKDGEAGLKLASGKVVYFSIEKLSKADQEYVDQHPIKSFPLIEPPELAPYMIREKNVFRYIDETGRVAFEAPRKTQWAEQFAGGAAKMTIQTDNGSTHIFVDKKGEVLLDAKKLGLEKVKFHGDFTDDMILFSTNGRYGYVNKRGNIWVKPRYGYATRMRDGVAWVKGQSRDVDDDNKLPIDLPNQKEKVEHPDGWSLINKRNEVLVTLPKDYIPGPFFDGISLVRPPGDTDQYEFAMYYDVTGKLAFGGKKFEGPKTPFFNGYAAVGKGVIDNRGKWVVQPKLYWDDFRSEHGFGKRIWRGLVLTNRVNGKYSLGTKLVSVETGKVLTTFPEGYYGIGFIGEGLISYLDSGPDKGAGLMNLQGETLLKLGPHDGYDPKFHNGLARIVVKKGKQTMPVISLPLKSLKSKRANG